MRINVDSFFNACKSIFENAIKFLPIKSKTLIHENASAKDRLASAKITTNIKAPKHQDKMKENLIRESREPHQQIVEGKLLQIKNIQRVGKNKKLK